MSIRKLSENSSIQVGTGKNLATTLDSETTKPDFFWRNKDYKKANITKGANAFKNQAESYNVESLNSFNPELQLKLMNLRLKVNQEFWWMNWEEFEIEDETKHSGFYSNTKAETIIHNSDIDHVLGSVYSTIMTKIQKYQTEDSGWATNSVIDENIRISKYKPLSESSYIKLQKE